MTHGLRERVRRAFGDLQDRLTTALEQADGGARFREDRWEHGITRVIEGGALFEKGGVNLSALTGRLSTRIAARLGVAAQPFYAAGVSLVLHPENPFVPTVHLNVRFLELPEAGEDGLRSWFGGGADLTPYYLFDEDARHFHRVWKEACDAHDPSWHPRFKQDCDEYFFLPHRGEARGVGGIFFDYLKDDLESTFAFVLRVGDAFLPAYLPIVERRSDLPWGEAERRWQSIRRGRYVEFNLVHDRGTLFGLETGGRTESILMSLPPHVTWAYDHRPEPGTPEADLVAALATPRDWV